MTETFVQPSVFDAPAAATEATSPTRGRFRKTGPTTSRNAAEQVAPRTGTHRARILVDLLDAVDGRTAEESWKRTGGRFPHVAGTRLGELQACDLVYMTARTRPTDSGADAHVWVLTDAGRAAALHLRQEAG